MSFILFNPKSYVNAVTNKKYNPKKEYDVEYLTKITPRQFKSVIKNILMLDNAYEKFIDISAYQIAEKYDMSFIYENKPEDSKSIWAEFIIVYQNALKTEIERVTDEIESLKQNLGVKQNNKKFELLSFYKDNLLELTNTSFEDLNKMAYDKMLSDAKDIPNTMIFLANLYRHAKEYERLIGMFHNVNYERGLIYNKEPIHSILKEIDNPYKSTPRLQEIYRLMQMLKNGENVLRFESRKYKKQSIRLDYYIVALDKAYLQKINIIKYLEAFYYHQITKNYATEIKQFKDDEVKKHTFIRSKYVELTRNYPEFTSKSKEILDACDRGFFQFNLNDNYKLDVIAVENQINLTNMTLTHIIPEMTKTMRDTNFIFDYVDVANISLEPYDDPLSYTRKDFFNNNAKITDPLFEQENTDNQNKSKSDDEQKSNDNKESKFTNEQQDLLQDIFNDTNINLTTLQNNSQNNNDLPKVDPNLPLDKKIDAYFSGLIGLNDVKQTLLEIIAKKVLEGKNYKQGQMHMAFLGNPGTGKTTVARIVGRILYENGLINCDKVVECKFSDLYQNYVGFSAKATQEKIKQAEGGVLFIDEAHQLACADGSSKDFRKEIINVLIPELENNKNLLVIFAGYEKEMNEMLKNSDKGLFSRVNHRVVFKDFTKDDVVKLFKLEMSKKKNRKDENFVITDLAQEYVEEYFDLLIKARKGDFANGREVRVTVNKILNKFGVLALNRKDIKTIDGETMKEILTSSSFEENIMTGNENNPEIKVYWQQFVNNLEQSNLESACCA